MDALSTLRDFATGGLVLSGLCGVVAGLLLIARGQALWALRDIAINSWKAAGSTDTTGEAPPTYAGLALSSPLIEVTGWLILGLSVVVPAAVLLSARGGP